MIDGWELLDKIMAGYDACEPATRSYIDQMVEICIDLNSTDTERMLAFNTILDGLASYLTEEELQILSM